MHYATKNKQQGSALLVLLAIILAGMAFLIIKALNSSTVAGREQANAAVLAQAKQALIGFAASYRDTHVDPVFGNLPCPDTNNDGIADPPCGAQNVSVIGHLPWKTLGLPPLRDSAGECLWYAVSGRAKDNPITAPVFKNWDTTSGQFQINDASGAILVAAGTNDTPWAVIFAPGTALTGQNRTAVGVSECGGNNTASNYLENGGTFYAGTAPAANANTTLTISTSDSIRNNTNNDQGQWITSGDIFDVVKNRSDFKTETDTMLGDIQSCLDNQPVASLPAAVGSKGIGNVIIFVNVPANCPGMATVQKNNVLNNWQNSLLYTANASTVNGAAGCNAVLLFGGERTTRTVPLLTAQTRVGAVQQGDATEYLEGTNATLFPTGGNYVGASYFSATTASADLVRCIKGLPAGATQTSFANNFASFTQAGVGVTTNVINPASPTVSIANAAGTSGGCFWLPGPVAVAGKTVRAYYEYQFSNADTYALTGIGTDHGNGITLDIVDGTLGAPISTDCGLASHMGAFEITDGIGMWAGKSFTIETDVHNDALNTDPVENHTAIMAYGNLQHGIVAGSNGYLTTACNGTAAGCRFSPANKFEESPTPRLHNQRVEIHSGCNSTCSTCNPASYVAPNNYVKISAWVDCSDCNDVTTDSIQTPTIKRCIILDPALNSPYIALTGGFRAGAAAQGVTLSNFILRSE